MACQCAPALTKLRDEIDARWPDRDKASDGCCASSAHTKTNPTSDHEPTNGYAHAIDIDEDLDAATHSLAFLVPALLADSRCKYVIYEKLIHYPGGVAKPYSGANPHDKHLHLSIKATATFETRSWLTSDAAPPAPPPMDGDDLMQLTEQQQGEWNEMLAAARGAMHPANTPPAGQHRLWTMVTWALDELKALRAEVAAVAKKLG